MADKTLEKDFQDGLKDALYYFWSDDPLLLEHALTRAIDTIISGAPVDFNYDTFHPSSNPEEIRDAISTVPFMAKRRLVVLRDFHQFPGEGIKAILPSLEDPPDTACIIILSQKAPKKDFNIRCKVYNLNISDKDMASWVKEFALKKGVRLNDDAINLLLEFAGYDTGVLSMEIEKLSHLSGKVITDKDIMNSIVMMRQFTAFDLIDSLLEGKKAGVLRILKALFDEGKSTDTATLLLGALNWQYREFYNLWLQNGKRPARMSDKRYRLLMRLLPSYNEARFYNIFNALHKADVMIKTGGRAELVMEVLLINLFEKVS
ncbi:MAG: DNA polymerase III subunit delta [Thermodesulfovibrionia bacterium]